MAEAEQASTALFEKLYHHAFRREHPQVVMVRRLLASLESTDLATCARLADRLVPAWQDYDDALMKAARGSRCRIAKVYEKCPICGRPDCPESAPLLGWQADYVAYLMAGGTPMDFEESGS